MSDGYSRRPIDASEWVWKLRGGVGPKLEPWQAEFLASLNRDGAARLPMPRASGKVDATRMTIEDWLERMSSARIEGDNLVVNFPDGTVCVGVGYGRLLLADTQAEAERITE